MNLSQFEEAVGHRRGADPGPNEAWYHGCEIVSPVEAVFELGEVARYMLAADGTVGSDDRRLDVTQCRIDPFEGRRARRLRPRAGFDDLMRAAGIGHAGEAPKPVADHRAVRVETALGEPEIAWPQKLVTRRNFRRTGLPSWVVSTAATNGVLPGAPRPRLPPVRSPPR